MEAEDEPVSADANTDTSSACVCASNCLEKFRPEDISQHQMAMAELEKSEADLVL